MIDRAKTSLNNARNRTMLRTFEAHLAEISVPRWETTLKGT